jgi:hypothetical protein
MYGLAVKLFHEVLVATENGAVDVAVELPEMILHVLSKEGRFQRAKPCQAPSLDGI